MATSPKLTPRLRASCDGCYTAKIKCTKERPTCSRCKSLGLVCNYSPSQRAGGRSREVRARHESSLTSQAPDRTPQNLSNQASPILPMGRQSQPFGSTTLQTSDGFHPLWSDPTISECPGSANMLGDFDDDFLKPWRDYLPTPEEQSSTFNMSEELVTYTDNATSHLVQPELIPTPPPSSHDNVRACDCFLSMVQALNTIGNQLKTTRTPPLETVLSASKDVIARGEAVLHCTCSDDSALIMLLAGLISKHLSFYRCNVNGFASSPSSSSSSAGETNCSLPSSRVTIGKYMMDGDDEERLRIEIMMMELQKMGTLSMRFRGKFASLPVGYEGHTNETVLNFLNTRLREATDGLQREKQRLKGEP